ncbi:thiolase family protein [Metapseudomonas furukawaii]|uniref:thiolase family protein n=1 Tax=Metapseudomonas furukawaii TaxID=1149133 RepID=UPI00227B0E12|nr:thiolase family protein [Pseudomonas furukawaii]WAG81571.1 thiolase family protein [Pseudomonas furukawaii]
MSYPPLHIAGVGITPFGKQPDRSVKDLVREAVTAALQDAGCEARDVQAIYFATAGQGAIEGQHMVAGEIALKAMGITGIPVTNVENACASSSTALNAAQWYVAAGGGDICLVVGVDKLFSPDKEKSFAVFDGAWDVHTAHAQAEVLRALAPRVQPPADYVEPGRRSVFMDIYASLARLHMQSFGTTQRQIAAVAAKNHTHSMCNPMAQFQYPLTIDEVMAARAVSWPLTLPMCAPIGDGAAAAIVCNEAGLRRLKSLRRERAVRLHASVLRTATERAPEDYAHHLCHLAALEAYEKAGVGPQDMSLAEVHDATAFAEIQQTEALGFCAFGEGGPMAESGATTLGGRIPINVNGGLLSRGHPIGATGLAQVHEMVTQLRGEAGARQVEGARFAIAENGGGFNGVEEAVTCITILGR